MNKKEKKSITDISVEISVSSKWGATMHNYAKTISPCYEDRHLILMSSR